LSRNKFPIKNPAAIASKQTRIPDARLEKQISELLDVFYGKRIASLSKLKLESKFKEKNTYLVKATGAVKVEEIVADLLNAHISSSDETMFGNEFFEPLAKWVAAESFKKDPNVTVQTSGAGGCDILISMPTETQAIAVKSGKKVFNSQSRKEQVTEFKEINSRLRKEKKHFRAIVGYGYGSLKSARTKDFEQLAGEQFWEHISGEKGFYLRVIDCIKMRDVEHRPAFIKQYKALKRRLVLEFRAGYSLANGSINWEKLAKLSSGITRPARTARNWREKE